MRSTTQLHSVYVASCFAAFFAVETATAGPTFTNVGAVGSARSYCTAISSDGTTVTGWYETAGIDVAFRWTAATGVQNFTNPNTSFRPRAISSDGSVITGSRYRWSATGGLLTIQ